METKSWKGGTIRLKWSRDADGYYIDRGQSRSEREGASRERRLGDDVEPAPVVCRKGGELLDYDIAIGEERVFLDLLNSPARDDDAALNFARDWGALFTPGSFFLNDFFVMQHEMQLFYKLRFNYKELARVLSGARISRLDARIGLKNNGSVPELLLYARNLKEFCWLEVLADVGGVSEVVKCVWCGQFFVQTSTMGRNPEYCSNRCRQAGYRARKQAQRTK